MTLFTSRRLLFWVLAFIGYLDVTSAGDRITRQKCTCEPKPADCSDMPGTNKCGVYMTRPGLGAEVPTYCNTMTDGGGWVVIQKRTRMPYRPRADFDVNWEQYKWGFGSLAGEFWWGLEHVWQLTSRLDRMYELRIDMEDHMGQHFHALYQNFRVTSEADGYRLLFGQYTGNAGNALEGHLGAKFSTYDNDKDREDRAHCAQRSRGGWWFNKCSRRHLNGFYSSIGGVGVSWATLPDKPLKEVVMLVRPTSKMLIGCHGWFGMKL